MANRLNLAISILLALALGCQSRGQPSPPSSSVQQPAKPPVVQIQDLAATPEKYVKQTFLTSGTLENQGANYFTDLRVVLKDDRGRFVHVKPWLPLSLPPSPPGRPAGERRPVLSDFLGKKVELTATIEKGELRGAGNVFHLTVKEGRILP